MLVWILLVNAALASVPFGFVLARVRLRVSTIRKLGIHAKTLGTVLDGGPQADARGATQVLDRCGQAVARGSCLSQVLDRGAEECAPRPHQRILPLGFGRQVRAPRVALRP